MSSAPALTTTSYAILGLLAVRPWTTHELVQQVDRSLRRIWPRAQSKLYEEPKKLVVLGLTEAVTGSTGRRPRTVYSITPAGRQALATWLAADSAEPVSLAELTAILGIPKSSAHGLLASLLHLRNSPEEQDD